MDFLKLSRRASPLPAISPLSETRDPASESPLVETQVAVEDTKRWVGYIDHVDRTVITGWACDIDNIDRSVPVEVVASNGKRATVVAAVFRQDVKEAGYGTGNFGFEIDVGRFNLKDETLIVRFAESKVAISTAPFSLEPQRALLDGKLPASYTNAMQMLGLQLRDLHAEFEHRTDGR